MSRGASAGAGADRTRCGKAGAGFPARASAAGGPQALVGFNIKQRIANITAQTKRRLALIPMATTKRRSARGATGRTQAGSVDAVRCLNPLKTGVLRIEGIQRLPWTKVALRFRGSGPGSDSRPLWRPQAPRICVDAWGYRGHAHVACIGGHPHWRKDFTSLESSQACPSHLPWLASLARIAPTQALSHPFSALLAVCETSSSPFSTKRVSRRCAD